MILRKLSPVTARGGGLEGGIRLPDQSLIGAQLVSVLPSPTRRLVAASTIAATGALILSLPVPAQAAVVASPTFGGSAYGSTVQLGSTLTSGRTSAVSMCTQQRAFATSNNTAKTTLSGLGSVGAATTSLRSSTTPTKATSLASARTGTTVLLGGLISAQAITSTASVSRGATGYTTAGSSVFTGLRIGTRTVTATTAPNTVIEIPGVATVRLNVQSASTSAGTRAMSTTGMRITLLQGNRLKLPTSTITVAAANATQNAPTNYLAYGSAYGTRMDAAGVVQSGATAAVGLPCGGSSGTTRTNNLAGTNLAPALRTGALTTTAASTEGTGRTTAATTAKVSGVNLLNGLVTADAITTKATATRTSAGLTSSATGTTITGLRINGVRRTVSSAENSTIKIAGVGTLTLRGTSRTTTGVTVTGLQLSLDTQRLGLPAGTLVRAAVANAGVNA